MSDVLLLSDLKNRYCSVITIKIGNRYIELHAFLGSSVQLNCDEKFCSYENIWPVNERLVDNIVKGSPEIVCKGS